MAKSILKELNKLTYVEPEDRNDSTATEKLAKETYKKYEKRLVNANKNLDNYTSQVVKPITLPTANSSNKWYTLPKAEPFKREDIINSRKEHDDSLANLKNLPKYQDLTNKRDKLYDETANYYDTYLNKKLENDNIGLWDKTGGVLVNAAGSFLPGKYKLKNQNGDKYEMKNYFERKQEKTSQAYETGWGKFLGDTAYNIGKIGVSVVGNTLAAAATGGMSLPAGTALYFTDMFNDQYNRTIEEGYSKDKALMYASVGTISEALTEKLIGGIGKSLGLGTSEMSKGISAKLTDKLIKNSPRIANVISNAIAEGSEEFVQEYFDNITRSLILDGKSFDESFVELFVKDGKFNSDLFTDALYSAAVGSASGGLSGALDSTNYSKMQKAQDAAIKNMIMNDTSTVEDSIVKNSLSNAINQNTLKQGILPSTQDTAINKMLLNPKDFTVKPLLKRAAYQYETTGNVKIDNLKASASKFYNNSVESRNMIDTVAKIVSDKNYNVIFDDTIATQAGTPVNGQIKKLENGEVEIRINPNSDRAVEFLIAHEVTHGIENQDLVDTIMKYASKNKNFESALTSRKQIYGTNDVTSEVVADISAQVLGKQEFINSLFVENTPQSKNIIKKIYEGIKKLLNNLTEEGRYKNFVQDLETKWREAYRNTTSEQSIANINENTHYSIKQDKNGNKYVNIDIEQNQFDNLSLEQQRLRAKNILKNKFNEGIVLDEDIINFPNRSIKEYTNPQEKISNTKKRVKYRLTPELDNALKIAKKINTKLIPNNDLHKYHEFAKDGWNYYYTKFKYGDIDLIGKINEGVSNGKPTFYNITDIGTLLEYKKMTENGTLNKNETALIQSFLTNNIPQSNNNVKSDISSTKYSMQSGTNNTQEPSNSLFALKEKQNEIIQKFNPVDDANSRHTWIRSAEDIKTFEETLQDIDYKEYFESGEDFDESYTAGMAQEALDTGKIIVYSSYPIEQGIFVSPSKMEAESYSGNGKVYSKEVNLTDIAWIDPTQGQYAKVDVKYSQNSDSWQEYLENNYKATGTRTLSEDIRNDSNDGFNDNPEESTLVKEHRISFNDKISIHQKEEIIKKVQKTVFKRREKAINMAVDDADRYVSFTKKQEQDFKNRLNELVSDSSDSISDENLHKELRKIISKYANREITYTNQEISEIKNYLKKNGFKNNSKEVIYNGSYQNINDLYLELSKKYPGYFNEKNNSVQDKFEKLSSILNIDDKITTNYGLDEEGIELVSASVIRRLKNKMLSEQDIKELAEKIESEKLVRTRKVVYKELLDDMDITVTDLLSGEDIKAFNYGITDTRRVFEKVFDEKTANKLIKGIVEKTAHNESLFNTEANRLRSELKKLDIKSGSKESAAVQKYAEGYYYNDHGERLKYNDKTLAEEFSSYKTQDKIKNAAKWFRNQYDLLLDRINEVYTSYGYAPIEKRTDYMPHMMELTDFYSRIGGPLNPESMKKDVLPTDINGLTDEFKPGKKYFANAQRRKGEKTIYDAVKGFDNYIDGALFNIYHTDSIQRRRALSSLIRETFGQKGTETDNYLYESSPTEQAQRRLDIFGNKLSKFVNWLDTNANYLAGKKGSADRWVENFFGRKAYTVLQTAKKQVGSNMTGFNVRSSLTNFASILQGASKTNKISLLQGIRSTISNMIQKDELTTRSDFLNNRLNATEKLVKKPWDRISNAGQFLMNLSDNFSTNVIWRSKYFENLHNGMNEAQAIIKADDFTARVMGDRSRGASANIFNEKTLGVFTQFQLEVNNQWQSMIHDNKTAIKNGNLKLGGLMLQAGQLMAFSYMFNNLMKAMTGSDVMVDFVDMFKQLFIPEKDDDRELEERVYDVLNDLVDQLPFANIITSGGRIPVAEAFTGIPGIAKGLFHVKNKYGNETTLKEGTKDFLESALYWIFPTGFGQLKKTFKGLTLYNKNNPIAGSYTDSGNLRFTADDSTKGGLKSAIFGAYSSKEAQDYIGSGFSTIRKENIQEMKDLKMNSSEYRKYRNGLTAAGKKTNDKIDYIYNSNYSTNQKNIMAQYIYTSDTAASKEELKKISSLNFSSKQKASYYKLKSDISVINQSKVTSSEEKNSKIAQLILDSNLSNEQMGFLYSKYYSSEDEIENLISMNIPIKEYIKLNSENIESDYNSKTGKIVNNSKKNKVISYINSLNLNVAQKAILIKMKYSSYNSYNNQIIGYINKLKMSANDKKVLLKSIGFNNYNKDVINYINSQNISKSDKEKKLKSLGFTIRDGKVFS